MKDVLYVSYLDQEENSVNHSYDIATLKVGGVNKREYSFDLVEKHEDNLVVKWGCNSKNSVEVFKNGGVQFLFTKDVEFDDNGSWYDVIETLCFEWIEEE